MEEHPEGNLAARPTSQRVYRSQTIAVSWNPRVCMHAARCVAGLPNVFQPGERPWVKINAATADEIATVIARCPSGALHFERLDGGPQEQPDAEMTVTPRPNGPLYVRGNIRIVNSRGELVREDTRMALCRCGNSENKPFCDGSHRRVGFKAPS
jgi:uncharacterized Fe-S cluster protein YjdI